MYCSSCGKKITENSKFCKYCGVSQIEIDNKKKKNSIKDNYETVWTCDFCGEEFKTKKESDKHELLCIKNPNRQKRFFKNNSQKSWFYLWIITLLVFVVSLFINAKFNNHNINLFNSEFLNGLFFFNILVGINAFIAMIVASIKNNNKISYFTKNILIISLAYFFINISVFAVEGFKAQNDEEYKNKYYARTTPTIVPTIVVKITPTATPRKIIKTNNTQNTNTNTNQGSQIDCIGPDGVHFKTTKEECEKFNSDWGHTMPTPTLNPYEWIKCPISANCGGGYKDMTRQECQRMTCCQTDAKGWYLTSKDECDRVQRGEEYADWVTFCKSLYPGEYTECGDECWKCIEDHT